MPGGKTRAQWQQQADEIERLQVCFDQRNDALIASCKRNGELQDRVEKLEAAIDDAMPCLNEHDPEVAAICRAATDKGESGGSWKGYQGWLADE